MIRMSCQIQTNEYRTLPHIEISMIYLSISMFIWFIKKLSDDINSDHETLKNYTDDSEILLSLERMTFYSRISRYMMFVTFILSLCHAVGHFFT